MTTKNRKLYRQAFKTATTQVAAVTLTAQQSTRFAADAEGVTLVALPVLPASPFRTQDSRSGIEYSYDAAQLIATHAARKRKLPLDVEHATEVGGAFTQPDTRARGWVHALCTAETEPELGLEQGVLYALVELTSIGLQELADKLYGYTSAVALGFWLDEGKHSFLRIKSLALTNNPACELPALFSADGDADAEGDDQADHTILAGQGETQSNAGDYTDQQPDNTDEMKLLEALRTALGLAADADADAALAAVNALSATAQEQTTTLTATTAKADEAATALTAAQAQITTLTADLEAARTALTARDAADAERAVLSAVDAAISARKATPAQRDSLVKLATADLAAFTAAMQAAPEILSADSTQAPVATQNNGLADSTRQMLKQLRIDEKYATAE